MPPTTAWATVRVGSTVSDWSSMPMSTPRRRVTRPPSGSMRPASRRSNVDLPSPFLPTTPTRSPSLRPTVTPSKMTRVGNSSRSFSPPSRCAISGQHYPRGLPTDSLVGLATTPPVARRERTSRGYRSPRAEFLRVCEGPHPQERRSRGCRHGRMARARMMWARTRARNSSHPSRRSCAVTRMTVQP